MQKFTCKTRIVTGEQSMDALKELGIRRLFLVTDPYFHNNGMAQQVAQRTGAEQTEIFSRVSPDPDVQLIAESTAQCKAF